MKCISDGGLRARVDGELSAAESGAIQEHLATCARCRERAEQIAREAANVTAAAGVLAPVAGEADLDPGFALARFRTEHVRSDSPSFAARLFARHLRPAWVALAGIVVLAGVLSFAPGSSWAQKLLAMLRVQKIAVVPVDLPALGSPNANNGPAKMIGQMLSDKVVVTLSSKPRKVDSADDASQLAGYHVKVVGSRSDTPQFTVEGEQGFQMTIDRDRVQAILDEAGRSDVALPVSVNGALIAVHIPSIVAERYGTCPNRENARDSAADFGDCVELVQVPSPTVSVPPDLNIEQLAEVGLQLAGMTPSQAHAFCQTVDWTSTLVLPLPRFIRSYQTVEVNGVQGTLINLPPHGPQHLLGYNLVWVKQGVIYSLTGFGSPAEALPLAESLL
jgi:Putative zinc-finger